MTIPNLKTLAKEVKIELVEGSDAKSVVRMDSLALLISKAIAQFKKSREDAVHRLTQENVELHRKVKELRNDLALMSYLKGEKV